MAGLWILLEHLWLNLSVFIIIGIVTIVTLIMMLKNPFEHWFYFVGCLLYASIFLALRKANRPTPPFTTILAIFFLMSSIKCFALGEDPMKFYFGGIFFILSILIGNHVRNKSRPNS